MTQFSQESNSLYINSPYGLMSFEATPEGVVVDQHFGDHRQPGDPMMAILEGETIAALGTWLNELPDRQLADETSYVEHPNCVLRSRHQQDIHRVAILASAGERHHLEAVSSTFDRHLQTVGLHQHNDERGIVYAAHAYGRMLLEILPNQDPLPNVCSRWLGAWICKELVGDNAASGGRSEL